jgi:hypothetical protein
VGVNEGISPVEAWVSAVRRLFGMAESSLSSVSFPSSSRPKLDELEKLYELRQKGALTEEEYQRLKSRLL